MAHTPQRQVCPICGHDDDVTTMPGDAERTWDYTCLADGHNWTVKADTGLVGRTGITAEWDLYDDLPKCLTPGEPWVEHGVVEFRYKTGFPDVYFEKILPRYGHVGLQGSKRYTASSFIAQALRQLEREGVLARSYRRATGFWAYNHRVSYWSLAPGPTSDDDITWQNFALAKKLDPNEWVVER